jgi:hypothetical protein
MRKALHTVTAVAIVVGVLAVAPAAMAAPSERHTITQTINQHGTWTEDGDEAPCTGDLVTIHFDGNQVEHVTYFTDGDEFWGTFTAAAALWFVDAGVTTNGHVAIWGNFNQNNKNSNETFTFNVKATTSDGRTLMGHEVAHFATNANGVPVVEFDKMTLTGC